MKTIIGYSASGRVTNKALGKYMKRFNRIIGVFLTSFLGLTLAAKDPLESHLSKNQRCMSGMKALLYSAKAGFFVSSSFLVAGLALAGITATKNACTSIKQAFTQNLTHRNDDTMAAYNVSAYEKLTTRKRLLETIKGSVLGSMIGVQAALILLVAFE